MAKVLTMVLFALSCVGLLLFLWLSFGGTIPLNPQGYRVRISFPYAQQVATQADVRIAGVTVGRVVDKSLDRSGNRTVVTVELERKFAPIHRDATAILRQKTILGETYIQLDPGTAGSPVLADGGLLARVQVKPAVQLDQIFNAFDPTTRHAFGVWQQSLARAARGNDQNLNDTLGNLPSFAASASDVLSVLDVEHSAVVGLLRNGGTVFAALAQNQGALRNLVSSGETTFHELAVNANSLAAIFNVFPTFLTESRLTFAKLQSFSVNADPVVRELVPVAQNLSPTLRSVDQLAPSLRRFFTQLGPLITVSRTGLPATAEVLNGARPLLGALGPFLEELNPILGWLSLHQQLVSDFISTGSGGLSATTTSFTGGVGHYLRQFGPTGPETLGLATSRDANNRGNTYPPPTWLADPAVATAGGQNNTSWMFPSWDCRNTGAGGNGTKPADLSSTPATPACWVAPRLPGSPAQYLIPQIKKATYSSK